MAMAIGAALLGCGEKERPPRAPLGPLTGTILIGGGSERTRDGGMPGDAGPAADGGPALPNWCQPLEDGADLAEVIELGGVKRSVEFIPTTVTAKWSALFCEPGGRRYLRIGIADSDRCDLWSAGDPVHEIFLFVDVDAIRASELAPRGQPVVAEDDRVQVYYGRPGGTLWGLCGEIAGGSIDFESIGTDVGDRIALVLAVDLEDCAEPVTQVPVRVEARIDTVLQDTEADACAP
jgi:hypothetical protein